MLKYKRKHYNLNIIIFPQFSSTSNIGVYLRNYLVISVFIVFMFFCIILCLKCYINFSIYFFIHIILTYSCIHIMFMLFFVYLYHVYIIFVSYCIFVSCSCRVVFLCSVLPISIMQCEIKFIKNKI